MEGGLASALFTTHRHREELLPLILATDFLLSEVELLQNNSEYLSVDVCVICCRGMWLKPESKQCTIREEK